MFKLNSAVLLVIYLCPVLSSCFELLGPIHIDNRETKRIPHYMHFSIMYWDRQWFCHALLWSHRGRVFWSAFEWLIHVVLCVSTVLAAVWTFFSPFSTLFTCKHHHFMVNKMDIQCFPAYYMVLIHRRLWQYGRVWMHPWSYILSLGTESKHINLYGCIL